MRKKLEMLRACIHLAHNNRIQQADYGVTAIAWQSPRRLARC